MKRVRLGIPEKIVPTRYCPNLNYTETDIAYDISQLRFKTTARGCVLEFPLEQHEQVYGFGLQLKGFNHKNHKLQLRANSDPVANTGDSHAPVPFFVTTKGYGMFFDTALWLWKEQKSQLQTRQYSNCHPRRSIQQVWFARSDCHECRNPGGKRN